MLPGGMGLGLQYGPQATVHQESVRDSGWSADTSSEWIKHAKFRKRTTCGRGREHVKMLSRKGLQMAVRNQSGSSVSCHT